MTIRNVTIVGLGALGILYAGSLAGKMPKENLHIVADTGRIKSYREKGILRNGRAMDFQYMLPEETVEPADLILIAVKYEGLENALKAIHNHVGPGTILLSLLNGIRSEEDIAAVYGWDKVLFCVAQGMDAVKEGNALTFTRHGLLCIGDTKAGPASDKLIAVRDFFEQTGIPYVIDPDMRKRMWGKFMLNVGINQTVAVYEGDYGSVQRPGEARDVMIAAMREVLPLAAAEGVNLGEEDIEYWLSVVDPLNPAGKPSMRQDTEAKRKTEVELFSGTVLELSKKHGIPAPVNRMLNDKIREMEDGYLHKKPL
jgi:2-dehydropantoate 2-reductase